MTITDSKAMIESDKVGFSKLANISLVMFQTSFKPKQTLNSILNEQINVTPENKNV